MSLMVGLMLLGFALIMVEIFIPGGVVGAVGGLCLLISIILAFNSFGMEGAIVAFLVALVGLGICLFVEFKILPKTPVGRRLFLQDRVEGKSQRDVADQSLVGKEGSSLTTLSPSGYVLVDGQRYEAYCRSGFLDKGEKVRVESFDQFKITVSKV